MNSLNKGIDMIRYVVIYMFVVLFAVNIKCTYVMFIHFKMGKWDPIDYNGVTVELKLTFCILFKIMVLSIIL